MKKSHTLCLATALAALLPQFPARAGIQLYEGFDYPEGDNIHTKAGGTGFGTNAWSDLQSSAPAEADKIAGASLSYGTLQTSGNALRSTSLELGGTLQRTFTDIQGTTGTKTWSSFLIRGNPPGNAFRVNEPVAGDPSAPRSDRFFLELGNSTRFLGIGIFQNSADELRFGLNNSQNFSYSATVAQPATTYLLVVSILWNTVGGGAETAELFINPTVGGAAPTVADAILSLDLGASSGNATNRLRNLNFITRYNAEWTFDELRIGESFADVTPVPEPAAGLLAALGAGVLALRRRRRGGTVSR